MDCWDTNVIFIFTLLLYKYRCILTEAVVLQQTERKQSDERKVRVKEGFQSVRPPSSAPLDLFFFFFHRALKPRLAARGWSIPLFSASPPSFLILLHLWGVHLRLDFLFYCTFVLMCHREEQTCRGDSVHHHYLHFLIHGVTLNCIKGRSSHQKV